MFRSQTLQKIIRFGVYAALLTPLVYVPQAIFGAVFGKMVYFQIAVELTLPFFLYFAIFHKDCRPRWRGLTKFILIFFAALFLSSLLGVDWQRSFWGTPGRMRGLWALSHFLFFYFYIITAFRAEKDKKKLFLFAIIVGLAVAAYGVLERINPSWSIDKTSLKAGFGHRVMSTTGNSIFLAGYMIFIFFLSLYYFLANKDKTRWIGPAGVALAALVLLYTGTRGALLGLMAGIIIFLALSFFLMGKKQKIAAIISAALILAAIILLSLANISAIGKSNYFNFDRITGFSLKNPDGSVSGRFLLWDLSLRAFKEKPVFGWGLENYDYAFDKYYNPQFFRGGINETWSDRAHNLFLDFLVMGGAVGLAAFLSIFVFLARTLFKKRNFTRENVVFCGLFAAFAAHSFVEVDDPSTTLMFFFALAVCSLIFNSRETNRESGANMRVADKRRVFMFLCFCVFMFLCAYFYNIKPLYAGIDFISFKQAADVSGKKALAEKFLSQNTPYSDEFRFRFANESFLDVGNISDPAYNQWALTESDKEMQAVLLRHPGDYSYFHALGNIYLREGSINKDVAALDSAIGLYKKALEISPRRQATTFQLATAYILRGRASEAVDLLKKAVSDDEKVGQSHWRLGVALSAGGQKEEAYKAFKNSIALGFFDTIEGETQQAGALCAQFKDYDCVVKIYEVLSGRSPDSADIIAQLAAAYAMAGRFEDARNAVMKAVELDSSLEAEAKVFLKQIGY